MLAFSRTGQLNLNDGKVGADPETSKAVEPGVGCDSGFCRFVRTGRYPSSSQ